jgi:hypothetical protein
MHELQPGRGRENDIEVEGVLPDPAAEAVEQNLVIVEQCKTNPSWRCGTVVLVVIHAGGPRR